MFNRMFMPGNLPGADSPVIPVEEQKKEPVTQVIKKQPFNFNTAPNSLPGRATETKEVNAANFPKLRGFA
jgi:hypothetical protein